MFTSSGSADSDRAVNPTRSQNRAVTTLRSSRCPTSRSTSGVAHPVTKAGTLSVLVTTRGADHYQASLRPPSAKRPGFVYWVSPGFFRGNLGRGWRQASLDSESPDNTQRHLQDHPLGLPETVAVGYGPPAIAARL